MCGTSYRTRLAGLVLFVAATVATSDEGWTQVAAREPSGQPCAGFVVGTVGILDMDCRRGCALMLRGPEQGSTLWRPVWSFTVEPQITLIAPNSPAQGVLQEGDRIVAVDGFLITTPEGGRRFAKLVPDSTVTIRYRRDGRTREATLRAVARCGPAVEGGPGFVMPTMTRDSISGSVISWDGPGILIQTWTEDNGRRTVMAFPRGGRLNLRQSGGRAVIEIPESRYGMNFSCGPCSSADRDGRRAWRFSNPIEVIGIAEGGPAERAGVRVGDRITHVDGERIDTRRGGEAFSSVRPGRPVQLTVTGRDGAERTVTLVPSGRE